MLSATKKILIGLLLFLLITNVSGLTAVAEDMMVPWTYPIFISDLQSDINRIANKDNLLGEDEAPDDLVNITVRKASSTPIQMRAIAALALEELFNAAEADGIVLYAKSGYRKYGTQKTMYYNRLEKNDGKDDGVVAFPGSSDHQTGLGIDVINKDLTGGVKMNESFGDTAEAQWIAEHCSEYGFFIRYPKGKTDITGVMYEPWHLRYVGKSAASYITGSGLTFEEYNDEWQKALQDYLDAGGTVEDELAHENELKRPQIYEIGESEEDGDSEISILIRE